MSRTVITSKQIEKVLNAKRENQLPPPNHRFGRSVRTLKDGRIFPQANTYLTIGQFDYSAQIRIREFAALKPQEVEP